jgi:hypothetical protein
MRRPRVLAAVLAATVSLLLGAVAASADEGEGEHGGFTCSGGTLTPLNPSIIPPGTYRSIRVTGVCLIPGGEVDVQRSLTVADGATLVANFPGPPPGQTGPPEDDAILNVGGNVSVGEGASLIMGCTFSFGCVNTTTDKIGGNLSADHPLGLILHADSVAGNYALRGGGGQAYDCSKPQGVFAAFQSPVYSTFEDGTVGGNVSITGYQSCWLGLARTQVGGNVRFNDNALGDPDAIEILSNTINGNLSCKGNKFVDVSQNPPTFTLHAPFDSTEAPNGDLFPRTSEPNTVNGKRSGQCVTANPPPGLF